MTAPPKRCTGHCCRDFTLPFSPGELRRLGQADRLYARAESLRTLSFMQEGPLTEGENRARLDAQALSGTWYADMGQIADMTDYLGFYSTQKMYQATTAKQKINDAEMKHHYSCRNLAADGRCGIYESRPTMCRAYPNGVACRYKGCTSAAAAHCNPTPDDLRRAEDTPG